MGGTITVKSTPGKGSEFTLILPLNYSIENAILETKTKTELDHSNNSITSKTELFKTIKTILLIDDSEPAIIQLKDFLEELEYNIIVAHDGSEALNVMDKTIPDGIVLDLMMPGTDGFKTLKAIRRSKKTAHVPVMILTAKQIIKEEFRFLKSNNIHQLVQKGNVNRKDLCKAVAKMVMPDTTEKKS